MHVSVLFEDEDVIAVNKPAGILVHRSMTSSRQETVMLQILRGQLGQRLYPVHRLDRATSGVLLLAKHSRAASSLGEQFRDHRINKCYLAVARGWCPQRLLIQHPLKDLERPLAAPQESETSLCCLSTFTLPWPIEPYPEARYSLLALYPRTGRRHQLRRHLKHIHHPLVGDTVYGKGVHNRLFREQLNCSRLLLHHWSCRWTNTKAEVCSATAPWDEAWQGVLDYCTWDAAGFKERDLWSGSH